jgi:hypothetical protein
VKATINGHQFWTLLLCHTLTELSIVLVGGGFIARFEPRT